MQTPHGCVNSFMKWSRWHLPTYKEWQGIKLSSQSATGKKKQPSELYKHIGQSASIWFPEEILVQIQVQGPVTASPQTHACVHGWGREAAKGRDVNRGNIFLLVLGRQWEKSRAWQGAGCAPPQLGASSSQGQRVYFDASVRAKMTATTAAPPFCITSLLLISCISAPLH